MSKAKAAIPLDEMNKQIANDCRNNAQKLREEAAYLEKCADIIDANKDYDQYELLKEFVEWFKNILKKEVWECKDEIDCEEHCGHLKQKELEQWLKERQVDIERLEWTIRNIDFELKQFIKEKEK